MHCRGKTTTPAAPSRTRTETPSQSRKNREQGGQNTSRKHSTDQPLPPHQTSHHHPSSWISTSTLPARPRSLKPSSSSSHACCPDGIPPEALKTDIQTSTDMLHLLLSKIWEQERVPEDWKRGHLVKLPEKGDLPSYNNWWGIMLLSIPGKPLTRIILERLKTALDKRLRVEQAGFRQDRSCTDHIAIMHIIIEQSLEWQTLLYTVFVDFQKAFDSVDRDVIWRLVYHFGFPPKFVAIIQQLEDATCQVIHDGKLTEPFSVQTGVRQGCLLSPTIFLMVVDWVMRQSTAGQRTGIQWTFTKQLEDLDFASAFSPTSSKMNRRSFVGLQQKLRRLNSRSTLGRPRP